ncbi:glycosyltransferase [Oligoflexus tunisiensis]|uniref:glycosyltransferase n=1 Tax=Oligoflexus tunisiensis TaxID=708132 RepID=UPI00159F1A72|nr:glycosyltransferase [Oligoflexus tunisiensis]
MKSIHKVLILSGLRLFPNQAGGHLRSGNVAKALARLGYDVCIYSLAGRKEDYGSGSQLLQQSIEPGLVEEINLALPLGLAQTLARRLGLPRLWQYPILASGLIPATLRDRLQWADCIICDLPFVPPVPGPWRKKPWVLLSHNLEYRLLEQGGFRDRHLFAPILLEWERTASKRYDGILACATEDYDFFQAHNREAKPIQLVPNGIDAALYAPDADARAAMRQELGFAEQDRVIVFSGSRYAPNVEALAQLQDFVHKHAEALQAAAVKFLILGSMAPASRSARMIATGFVPSVLPYFQAADFAINPVQRGSGSNVKIFEYLAARLPILSTEFGVRGSQLQPETDYLPFDWNSLMLRLSSLSQARSPEVWRSFGEGVWQRHAANSDMTEIVRQQWESLERSLPQFSLRLVSQVPHSLASRP